MCARRQRGDAPHNCACDRETFSLKEQCDSFLESICLHKTFDSLGVGHDCDETISLPCSVLISEMSFIGVMPSELPVSLVS